MTTNIDIASDLNVDGTSTLTGVVTAVSGIITRGIEISTTTNLQSLYILGNSNTGSSTQIFWADNGPNPAVTNWQVGPNYSTTSEGGGSGNDFWFHSLQTDTNILQLQNEKNVVNFNGSSSYPLTVNCNGALNVSGTSTLSGAVTAGEIQVNPTGGNPQGITINGSSSSGSGTQIFFQESGTTYWQLGPNYSTGGSGHDFWLWNPTTGTNILQIQNAANTINFNSTSSYPLTVNCNGALNVNIPLAKTYSGTSGSIETVMPFQGTYYKKFIAYVTSFENDTLNDTVIDFPTSFTTYMFTVVNTSGLTISAVGYSAMTISAPDNTTQYNGIIIIEGY